MKPQIIFLLIFIASYKSKINAQDELAHHKKYWFYKSRLNNNFIKVGNTPTDSVLSIYQGHGESIPFNSRHSLDGETNLADDVKSMLNMGNGDSPTQMGIYLAILATEYKLLKDHQQDLTRVKHEIFCVLNAINRIDYFAEPALDNSKAPNLNGFFIRDDVPKHFIINNYRHFNYYHDKIIYNSNPALNDSSHVTGFTDNYERHVTRDSGTYPETVSESSQDHYYYLLMGLTLTAKLVDTHETDNSNIFGFGSGETKLVQEAVNISERLIKYLKSDPFWTIINPNTNNPISGLGANAGPYSYALDNLGCFIKHNQVLPFVYVPGVQSSPVGYPYAASSEFRNLYSASPLASSLWQYVAIATGGGVTTDQVGFFQILAGVGNNVYENQVFQNTLVLASINAMQSLINSVMPIINQNISSLLNNWPGGAPQWLQTTVTALQVQIATIQLLVNNLYNAIQIQIQYAFPTFFTNTTDFRLLTNSKISQTQYFDPCSTGSPTTPVFHQQGTELFFGNYLRDILYGYNQPLPNYLAFLTTQSNFAHITIKNDVKTILDDAPCEGNHHYGFGIPNGFPTGSHWGAPNFIDRIDRVWKRATCPPFRGDFPGLDYLLMHNLFYLVEGTNETFEDLIDRTETTNYPNGSNFHSSNSQTMVKGAFEYIRPSNDISSSGKVLFRAGKEIVPVSGVFSVAQGAEVGFEINPYACSGLNDVSMNRVSEPGDTPKDDFDTDPKKHVTHIKPPAKQSAIYNNSLNQFQELLNEQKNKIDQEIEKINGLIKEYNKIEVYPNPNSGNFVIEFNLTNEDNLSLQITNMLGQIVYEENHITGTFRLPVSLINKGKGVYIAKVKFSSGKEEVRKISIQ